MGEHRTFATFIVLVCKILRWERPSLPKPIRKRIAETVFSLGEALPSPPPCSYGHVGPLLLNYPGPSASSMTKPRMLEKVIKTQKTLLHYLYVMNILTCFKIAVINTNSHYMLNLYMKNPRPNCFDSTFRFVSDN